MSVYKDPARGRFIFEFDARIDGRRIRARKILPKAWTRAQAEVFGEKERARLYAQIRNGERAPHSIEDAVTLYLEYRCPSLKSGANARDELLRVMFAYKGRLLTELPEACREIARDGAEEKEDRKPLSPATIRNRIRYLTAACRYAWKHHGLGDHDPAERVAVPQVNNERHVYATRQQILQMARSVRPDPSHPGLWRECRAALLIGFYSGMRVSEVLRARINGSNFDLGTTKNGKPRLIPIHPKLRSFLWIYRRALPAKITVQKHFRLARAACGFPEMHLHDVRHSAASAMINNGVDLYTVGAVLGHRDSRSTQRYAHLATETLAIAVGKIGQKKVA
ncbi:tyrosine-type recombinase/integrase [Burkholderia anthina]|uniref:tyrosine-type recombinase/integrase n=1 Tax=Burkholderia anthina TaxID=179879 RepID=UPI001AA00F78|nr:site-specific integrase [Burkholderia anthina]QTD88918.1 site-specific integrase [Burkholderia anthina]